MEREESDASRPKRPDRNPGNEDEGLSNTTDHPNQHQRRRDIEDDRSDISENEDADRRADISRTSGYSAKDIGDALLDDELELGIDHLTLYAEPLARVSGAEWEWDQTSVLNGSSTGLRQTITRHTPTGHKYRAFLTDRPDSSLFLKVTFNPSQFGPLVGIDAAVAIAEAIWEDLEDLVIFKHPVDESRIGRIDITVDFAPVRNLSEVLRLADLAAPRPRWLKQLTSRNGAVLGSTVEHRTVTLGSIVIYDKSHQAGLDEPTLRVEARVVKKARKKYGLVHLSDATPEALLGAFRAFSEPFTEAFETVPDLGSATRSYPARHIAEAIGILALEENGIVLPINKNRRSVLRRIRSELGIHQIADIRGLDESSN